MSSRADAVVDMTSAKKPSHKILMTKLLASGRHSDFTIVCGDRRFRVHKSILCERSEFINAAMSHSMRETAEKEIKLDQFDPDAVHGALFYAYTLCYPTDLKNTIEEDLRDHPDVTPEYWTRVGKLYWTYDLELFKVAHYLGLGALSIDAKVRLNERCTDPTSTLFLSRIRGYVLLVKQLYHSPAAKSARGYDDAEIYVDGLRATRKLLLVSTSHLVAEHIKNEDLDQLTEEIAEFKQDVFAELTRRQKIIDVSHGLTIAGNW